MHQDPSWHVRRFTSNHIDKDDALIEMAKVHELIRVEKKFSEDRQIGHANDNSWPSGSDM